MALTLALGPMPALALNIQFIPRAQVPEKVTKASQPELSLGELDLQLSGGSGQEPLPSVWQPALPLESLPLQPLPQQPSPQEPQQPPAQGEAQPPGGTTASSGSAQVPSAGSPSAGAVGIPGMGWGSGLPMDPTTDAFKGFHASLQLKGQDDAISGDATRSTHAGSAQFREDAMLSDEALRKDGTQLRFQAAMRYTDDPEIVGDGNTFRMEGQYFEAGRAHNYLLRAGDVTPQFSNYSFVKTGDGVHFIRNYEQGNGLMQLQVFGARTQRHKDPGSFDRISTGVRAARVWNLGEKAGHLGLGLQGVNVDDSIGSISAAGAAGVSGFPSDRIHSLNGFYDTPQGFHAEGEWAESDSELDLTGVHTPRRGHAQRESVGYTRSGKNLTIEHERVEATFDAVDSGASVDLDRQSVFLNVPLSQRLTLNSSFQRVYNDVDNQLGRTGENKTYAAGLTSTPFQKSKSPWLKDVSLGVNGGFARASATDGTSDRYDRDYTYAVSDKVRRMTLSYQLHSALDTDYITLANSRAPHHSSYQLGYDLSDGPKDPWKLSPFVNLGHDRDRNVATGIIDRANDLAVGVNGSWGQRSTFTAQRQERIQRSVAAGRLSFQELYQGEWNYQFDGKGDLKSTLQFQSQSNADSGQLGFSERKVLLSLLKAW